MFYVSQSLTENLSAEAFYQIEWDQTVVDNCGTFFSQPDVIADGCDNNLRRAERALCTFQPLRCRSTWPAGRRRQRRRCTLVHRGRDRDARDSGQWGASFKYMFDPLDTEFGAYFMNYHSRAPIFSATGAPAIGLQHG